MPCRALVAAYPEVQARLVEELRSAGLLATPENPTPRRPEYSDLGTLRYLDAVPALTLL